MTTTQPTYTSAAALGRLEYCVTQCNDAIADLRTIEGKRLLSDMDDRVRLRCAIDILHTIRNRLRVEIDRGLAGEVRR